MTNETKAQDPIWYAVKLTDKSHLPEEKRSLFSQGSEYIIRRVRGTENWVLFNWHDGHAILTLAQIKAATTTLYNEAGGARTLRGPGFEERFQRHLEFYRRQTNNAK